MALRRGAVLLALIAGLVGGGVPAVTFTATAEVFAHCRLATCDDARSAYRYWQGEGWPPKRVTNHLADGRCITGGGTFGNREGQLPVRPLGTYREFDVYPRQCGDRRDAHRIVVDHTTETGWYTDNHYQDFHLL
ncbi:ribonuclease domain-containing protein [Saccharothrix obliqua]|uniref:ribonuclease domain-containing protein n=1 Tax=Saccharothrix obliqua TaxID=2861747 RepID=UPI002151E795|nr:ribonuclease domain-containing protein [Saccharothrix obliqua]